MTATEQDTQRRLRKRIKTLSEELWGEKCRSADVDRWLSNFVGSQLGSAPSEQLHALHLLSSVSYFGIREIRELLRAMYRDLFRYPIIQDLRKQQGNTRDENLLASLFRDELLATRFLAMGNPSESGAHLLYFFRQENALERDLFVNFHELFSRPLTDPDAAFRDPAVRRIVFIDDFCGSGKQAVDYSRDLLQAVDAIAKRSSHKVDYHYFVLFGTDWGLARARDTTLFGRVDAVSKIQASEKAFEAGSHLFRKMPPGIDPNSSRAIAEGYGRSLWNDAPLGFDDGQLLLAFYHNVPDNTLPIIWFDTDSSWSPAFPRYPKWELTS